MKFSRNDASVFVPDGSAFDQAIRRVTHLGIGAHQDDLEIMAFHGILACFQNRARRFGAVIATNGGGSPRSGEYASLSDLEMAALRRREQEKAASLGDYGILVQLNYSSPEIKVAKDRRLEQDLASILNAARPDIVYIHNPADKHETHVAVALAALAATRKLPKEARPRTVYGCEVWRGLDWLADEDKVPLEVGGHEDLSSALIGVYASQVSGGKRYDLASQGRRRANATYFQSHGTDESEALWFAMDLTPLVRDDSLDICEYVLRHIDRFRKDVEEKIRKFGE